MKVYVIVKKGYSWALANDKVFQTKITAQLFLAKHCNINTYEVREMSFVKSFEQQLSDIIKEYDKV